MAVLLSVTTFVQNVFLKIESCGESVQKYGAIPDV